MRNYHEWPNAICELCTPETSLSCPGCRTFTCTHLSLVGDDDERGPNDEQLVHRCNVCEQELDSVSSAEFVRLSPVRAYLAGQTSWKEMEGEIRELSDQEDALRMAVSDLVKNAVRAPGVEERQAFCKQHGHSWIKPEYSSHRRCSYCGEYETPEGLLEAFRIEIQQATLGTATLPDVGEGES